MRDPRALRAFHYWAYRYRRSWRKSLLPSLIGPCLYMIVMGKVLGTLVEANGGSSRSLDGLDYLSFVAPAVIAVAAMLTASTEATSQVFNAIQNTHTYAAMLATPLRVIDLVIGHLLWMSARMVAVSIALTALVVALGAAHSWTTVFLVPIGLLTGMSIACALTGWSARQRKQANMLAWQRFGATPMLLFGGSFYPVSQLPIVFRRLAELTPIWHGAQLARASSTGTRSMAAIVGHSLYLVAFIIVGTWFAVRSLGHRLVEP